MTVEGGPTVSAGGRTPTDTGAEPRSGSNLVGPVRSETVLWISPGVISNLSGIRPSYPT